MAAPGICPRAVTFALGWLRLDYADGPLFLFTGRNDRPGGERTVAYFDPARRGGAVVLTGGAGGERLLHDVLALVDPASPVVAFLAPRE